MSQAYAPAPWTSGEMLIDAIRWTALNNENRPLSIVRRGNDVLAIVYGDTAAEKEANARLIGQAPAMADALAVEFDFLSEMIASFEALADRLDPDTGKALMMQASRAMVRRDMILTELTAAGRPVLASAHAPVKWERAPHSKTAWIATTPYGRLMCRKLSKGLSGYVCRLNGETLSTAKDLPSAKAWLEEYVRGGPRVRVMLS